MSSVRFAKVTKSYGGASPAVCDLTASIDEGELVVLVGPSGSGKSTALRMLAGLETPTAGELFIGDARVNDLPPAKRDVAMVFQDYALFPHMTARNNMAFGLKMQGTPRAEIASRVERAASLLGIAELLDRKPQQLSGGEQQRVALGRAIVRRPAVFLLDEPLANLDAQLRAGMRAELAELQRELAATMLYVTHDQVEAMTLGHRLVLLDRGVVQQIGPPMEVYRRPANRFVASFLGSPPMNLIAGQVDAGVFRSGELTWTVGGSHQGPAVLGIRPEHLVPVTSNEPPLVEQKPTFVEHLGHELLLHFTLPTTTLIARWPTNRPLTTDQPVKLTVTSHEHHLFAADEEGLVLEG
ncbi:ABC transporter ATP-binding protein [Aeoliella mucimassa]|uniref:sn-glycerol-3-phosphate import ATP-binding protein UgpC n=1 Tax=Aeoliella mucimassa TaxID=2527972 RepID=A0A518AHR2_9BACT|nr:ABC transporter ATP-binding protein [Aeoliella mucimassa]QDU54267.1 sn-glycerol-3-phosphate import ATP-binding protein UgpC [Aeoliella mucimassa]